MYAAATERAIRKNMCEKKNITRKNKKRIIIYL